MTATLVCSDVFFKILFFFIIGTSGIHNREQILIIFTYSRVPLKIPVNRADNPALSSFTSSLLGFIVFHVVKMQL